jgi:hypothetical protein
MIQLLLVGEDKNRPVPALVGEGADLAAADAAQARSNAQQNQAGSDMNIDENVAPVKMIVMDGMVVHPQRNLEHRPVVNTKVNG